MTTIREQRRIFTPRRVRRWRWYATMVLLPLLLPILPSACFALSAKGHEIVATIAEQFLEPRASEQLHLLLALDNETSLEAVTGWADDMHKPSRETQRWVNVNIPLRAVAYDPGRDCGAGACVVAKLNQFATVLRNHAAPPRDRLEALKYVVLLAGEIHQPMHAVDNGDHGGSRLIVICDGRQTSLRALWDDEILKRVADPRSAAFDLARSVSATEARQWQKDSIAEWANESHAIAKGFVYRYLPANGVLPGGYEAAVLPVALDRLKHAGIRLAGILNHSL